MVENSVLKFYSSEDIFVFSVCYGGAGRMLVFKHTVQPNWYDYKTITLQPNWYDYKMTNSSSHPIPSSGTSITNFNSKNDLVKIIELSLLY